MPRSGFRATKPGPAILAGAQGPRLLRPAGLSRALLPANLHNAQFCALALRAFARSSLTARVRLRPQNSRYAKSRGPSQGTRQARRRRSFGPRRSCQHLKARLPGIEPGSLARPLRPRPPRELAQPRPDHARQTQPPTPLTHCDQVAAPCLPHQGQALRVCGKKPPPSLDPAIPALRMVCMSKPAPPPFGEASHKKPPAQIWPARPRPTGKNSLNKKNNNYIILLMLFIAKES